MRAIKYKCICIMRIFSKFVFICNLCFVVSVIMHFVELSYTAKGKTDTAFPLPLIEGTLAVLGLLSLLVNVIFCLIVLLLLITKRQKQIPRWIVIFNFILLVAEIYWYIIDKSK